MSFSAVFLDVDDVMLDMDRIADLGVRSVSTPLEASLGDAAEAVQATFAETYGVLIKQLRSKAGVVHPDFQALRGRIEEWQHGVTERGYEVKIFSRHALMAIALERHGHPVTKALVEGPVDHYWKVLADATEVFPDAKEAIARLRDEGTPFQLATNSDGFLSFDDDAGTFRYDPEDAVRRKLDRLDALRDLGIPDEQITIGDPVGKPKPGFYDAVLRDFAAVHGRPAELGRAVAVGDSLTSDVLPFLDLGVRFGAWVQRGRTDPPRFLEDRPNVAVVGKLTDLWSMPWPAD